MAYATLSTQSIEHNYELYRSFSRKPDSTGKVTDKDFLLRTNETSLSVARTPEKAMDDLDSRGYASIWAYKVIAIGLGIAVKVGANNPTADPDLCEITGIPANEDVRLSIALALAAATHATTPVAGRRKRS